MLVAEKKLDYFPEEDKKLAKRPKATTYTKKRKKNNKAKVYFIAFSLMTTLLCISLLFRYVSITEMNAQIRALRIEQNQLIKERDFLLTELEGIKSSKNIEEQAIIQLGMGYPEAEQIIYVSVDNQDYQMTNEENDLFIIKHIKSFFNVIVSFF